MQHDIRHIGDYIFRDKDKYKNLSHEDKEKFFFIMNRKFARQYPKQAQFFNNKIMDKSGALDIWYNFFIKKKINNIPQWYWFKITTKKEKSIIKKEEEEFFLEYFDLKKRDLDFIIKFYPDELKSEIKKFKKFNK